MNAPIAQLMLTIFAISASSAHGYEVTERLRVHCEERRGEQVLETPRHELKIFINSLGFQRAQLVLRLQDGTEETLLTRKDLAPGPILGGAHPSESLHGIGNSNTFILTVGREPERERQLADLQVTLNETLERIDFLCSVN